MALLALCDIERPVVARSQDASVGTEPATFDGFAAELLDRAFVEAMGRPLQIPPALSHLPRCEEPLLGPGIPLPDCKVGVPRLHVLSPAMPKAMGTVVFLHGSCAVDPLGNKTEDGEPLLGGIAELAIKFQEEGFVSAVVNSYADGRREEINANGGTINRVDDIMSALQFAKDQNLPEPVHIYGKSNGGYALSMFLEMPKLRGKTMSKEKRAKASELLQGVDSCIIQCPFLSQSKDIPRLEAVANDSKVELPPTLFLLAEQDKMLPNNKQPILVGVEAAKAIVGGALEEVAVETVCRGDSEEVASQCTVLRGSKELQNGAARQTEVRVYSDIGHTFVCDAQHALITDGSNMPIVEHAAHVSVEWCRSRRQRVRALHGKRPARAGAAKVCGRRLGSKEECRRGSKENCRRSSKETCRS